MNNADLRLAEIVDEVDSIVSRNKKNRLKEEEMCSDRSYDATSEIGGFTDEIGAPATATAGLLFCCRIHKRYHRSPLPKNIPHSNNETTEISYEPRARASDLVDVRRFGMNRHIYST